MRVFSAFIWIQLFTRVFHARRDPDMTVHAANLASLCKPGPGLETGTITKRRVRRRGGRRRE